jgi:hypothetical protein
MQQKTNGRVVRLLTKHLSAEDRTMEQWFLVAVGDDDNAKDAVAKATNASDEVCRDCRSYPRNYSCQLGYDRW